jgi:hypothetical protein
MEKRIFTFEDKTYNMDGKPKDMQELFDEIVGMEKELSALSEQMIGAKAKHAYVVSKLGRRVKEMLDEGKSDTKGN